MKSGSIWQHRTRKHTRRIEYLIRNGRKTMIAFTTLAEGMQQVCFTLPTEQFLKTYEEVK